MARYVAFLRGINVTGRRISNPELRSRFVEMGFQEVAPFRASGNVIFDARGARPAELAKRIEEALAGSLGYEVPTFLRTATQVRAIAGYQAFPADTVAASQGRLQVAFLPRPPAKRERDEALGLATRADRLAIKGRELYWLPSGRMADATVDLNALERLIGPWTMRTKATVEQIAGKYLA
jgi:uncharacterized protein (DUF1697 family)